MIQYLFRTIIQYKTYVLLGTVLGGILLFLGIPASFAQMIDVPSPRDLPSIPTSGNFSFRWWLVNQIIPKGKLILSVIAVFYIIYYGSRMVFASGNDELVKKSKLALSYAAIGFIIINASDIFNAAFNPYDQNGEGPSVGMWSHIIGILITGLRYIAGTLAVAFLVLSGFRMITAAGKEEVIQKQKTQIMWSIFGLILVALAGTFQSVVFGTCNWWNADFCTPSPDATKGVSLLTSIINLILTFVFPLGFLFLVIGGMYMILSHGNDTMLTKGKKIVQWTVITLVIIYAAYVLVSTLAQFANNF
jgi:hypothetical protein